MVILALETVTRRGSIALLSDGACDAAHGDATPTHGERLPGAVIHFLARHGRRPADVDCFAVVSGPGSFTGTRVGIAAIQGLALATGKRVIPVPTLDAVASAWLDRHPERVGSWLVVPWMDGQRGDVFVTAVAGDAGAEIDAARTVIEPLAARPAEAGGRVAQLRFGGRVIVVGDAAMRHEDVLAALLPNATIESLDAPIAEAAVRVAARRTARAVSPHALKPIYLRPADAELARDRARAGGAGAPALAIGLATGPADVSAVEALQRRSFTNAWGAEAIRWELEHTDVARLYVARGPAGALVGYCACWMIFDELHINSLAVEPAFRRRGAARQILRRVIEEAVAAGARSATLEVRQSNQAARALYEGLGFQVEGVRRDYYQEPREDALVLWNRRLFAPAGALW